MEISNAYQRDIASIRNALSIFTLRQSLNQVGATIARLLGGLEEVNSEVQRYRESHLGNYVDLLI